MEFGIVPALAYLGSNIDVNNKKEDIDDKYYEVNFVYDNDRSEAINKIIESRKKFISKSDDVENTNIFNNRIKSINNIFPIYKDMSFKFYNDNVSNINDSQLFESFDSNLQNNDLSYEDQFKPLKYDSNKKQPDANNSHNSVQKSEFHSKDRQQFLGQDYSLFNNEEIDMTYGVVDKEHFGHNNMIPSFAKKAMINEYNTDNYTHKTDLFSGSSKEYVPKSELLQENFTPVQRDVNLVNGSRNNLEFLQTYYLPGNERRNQLPFEQTKVGPGLNLDPDQATRPDGGKQEEYRPIPRSTDQLRSADRPKETYMNVLKPGQKGNNLGVIGDVFKRRPEKTKEIDPNTFQKSGGEHKKQIMRNKIELRKTERKDSKPMIGPAKATNKNSTKNTGHVHEPFKTEAHSKEPANMQDHVKKHNPNRCSYKIGDTNRATKSDGELVPHPRRFSFGNLKFDPHDLPKQTIRQTTTFNEQAGYAKGIENLNKSYDPKDLARKTTRETTTNAEQAGYSKGIENKVKTFDPKDKTRSTLREGITDTEQAGYAKGIENKVTSFNPEDAARSTLREGYTEAEQAGYAKGVENKIRSYNPEDLARSTIRQIYGDAEQAGYAKGVENKIKSYNPEDLPKSTIRSLHTDSEIGGHVRGVQTNITSYNPENQMRPTLREQTEIEQQGYAKGIENRNPAYDPDSLMKPTLREGYTDTEQAGHARGEDRNPAYDPDDLMKPTLREGYTDTEQAGHAKGEDRNPTYDPDDLMKTTLREGYSDSKFTGHAKNDIPAANYFDPNDVARTTQKEDLIYTERRGHTMSEHLKPHYYDPNDIPAATLKELLIEKFEMGVAKGEINRSIAFDPKDIPAETLKELLIQNNYLSGVNKDDSFGGYLTNKYKAPETLRQLAQVLRFSGALGDKAPKDYSAEKNMELDDRKEILNQSRNPTNRSYDKTPDVDTNLGDVELNDRVNIERMPIINRENYHSNNFNLPSVYFKNDDRNEESNRLNPEILNQLNQNPLVNNPVISYPDDTNNNDC